MTDNKEIKKNEKKNVEDQYENLFCEKCQNIMIQSCIIEKTSNTLNYKCSSSECNQRKSRDPKEFILKTTIPSQNQ